MYLKRFDEVFFGVVQRDAQVLCIAVARSACLRPIQPGLRLPACHAEEDAEPAKIYAKPKNRSLKWLFLAFGWS